MTVVMGRIATIAALAALLGCGGEPASPPREPPAAPALAEPSVESAAAAASESTEPASPQETDAAGSTVLPGPADPTVATSTDAALGEHSRPANTASPDEPPPVPLASSPEPPTLSTGLGVVLTEGVEGLKLVGLAVGLSVQDRNPVGVATRFTTIPPRFHCHSVFDSRATEVTVIHTWRRNRRVVSRVELEIGKSPAWRTWSRQRIRAAWADRWSCTVTSQDGSLLGVATFEVQAESEPPLPAETSEP